MLENSPKTVKCVINFETDCGFIQTLVKRLIGKMTSYLRMIKKNLFAYESENIAPEFMKKEIISNFKGAFRLQLANTLQSPLSRAGCCYFMSLLV